MLQKKCVPVMSNTLDLLQKLLGAPQLQMQKAHSATGLLCITLIIIVCTLSSFVLSAVENDKYKRQESAINDVFNGTSRKGLDEYLNKILEDDEINEVTKKILLERANIVDSKFDNTITNNNPASIGRVLTSALVPTAAELLRNRKSTINQLRDQIAMLNEDLAGRQSEINRLRMENIGMKQQLGMHEGMSREEIRYHKFRHRIIGLLIRARDGYDYRDPFNHEKYINRFTISRSANGAFSKQHGFPKANWEKVNRDIAECIEQLSKLRSLSRETQSEWESIAKKIKEMNEQLYFDNFVKDLSENEKEFKVRKIKVGRSLLRALETIVAYMQKEEQLPDDPPEIIDDAGEIKRVTFKEMTEKLREAARE